MGFKLSTRVERLWDLGIVWPPPHCANLYNILRVLLSWSSSSKHACASGPLLSRNANSWQVGRVEKKKMARCFLCSLLSFFFFFLVRAVYYHDFAFWYKTFNFQTRKKEIRFLRWIGLGFSMGRGQKTRFLSNVKMKIFRVLNPLVKGTFVWHQIHQKSGKKLSGLGLRLRLGFWSLGLSLSTCNSAGAWLGC